MLDQDNPSKLVYLKLRSVNIGRTKLSITNSLVIWTKTHTRASARTFSTLAEEDEHL